MWPVMYAGKPTLPWREWQTGVKTLPYSKLRLRVIKMGRNPGTLSRLQRVLVGWGWGGCVFKNIFGGHKSFLWGHCYPCFGLLVTSPLGLKARVGSLICLINMWYTFPEIHHWNNTCWLIDSQHGSQSLAHMRVSAEAGCQIQWGDLPHSSHTCEPPSHHDRLIGGWWCCWCCYILGLAMLSKLVPCLRDPRSSGANESGNNHGTGVSKGRRPPPDQNFSKFFCSFWDNLAITYVGVPWRVGESSYGESWIHPCLDTVT